MTEVIDYNRKEVSFFSDQVQELLPEYFVAEYPTLVLFLEKYYEQMRGESRDSFRRIINELLTIRDIDEVSTEYLNFITEELSGLQADAFVADSRLMTKLLAEFFRLKGSLSSTELFFRAFYGEEVSIEYPKRQLFIVGESEIGYESLKFIQDNRLYQVFSILIKVGLSSIDYGELYKKFVHPAGFYFAGEVLVENEVFALASAPGIEDVFDSAQTRRVFSNEIDLTVIPEFHEMTALYDSNGVGIRGSVNETLDKYANLSIAEITAIYTDIRQLISPNSFTFDDSSAGAGPDMSNNLETMDNNMFTRYLSDSSY